MLPYMYHFMDYDPPYFITTPFLRLSTNIIRTKMNLLVIPIHPVPRRIRDSSHRTNVQCHTPYITGEEMCFFIVEKFPACVDCFFEDGADVGDGFCEGFGAVVGYRMDS